MLTDQEKRELAEIVALVLDSRMKELYNQIAAGFCEISNCMMEDLAKIFEDRTQEHIRRLIEQRQRELAEGKTKRRAGF